MNDFDEPFEAEVYLELIKNSPFTLAVVEAMDIDSELISYNESYEFFTQDDDSHSRASLRERQLLRSVYEALDYTETLTQDIVEQDENYTSSSEHDPFSLTKLENLTIALSVLKNCRFSQIEHESLLKEKVLTHLLDLLKEIRTLSSTSHLSDLKTVEVSTSKGSPRKTAENNARFAYIQSLIDGGLSETKAFKKASEVFYVSTDALRKPYKDFVRKQSMLKEALANIKPIKPS